MSELELIEQYLDGELTRNEQEQLAQWLAADKDHVRQFVRETHLHRQIRETMLARPYRVFGLSELPSPQGEKGAYGRWLPIRWRELVGWPWALRGARALTWAAGSVVLVALGVWWFGAVVGVPVLAEVQGGSLLVERLGQTVPGRAGIRLEPGDSLRAPEGVTARITFAPEKTRLTLLPGTELKLVGLSGGKRFDIAQGKVEASVARQRPFHPMTLRTPQAEARVLGTRFTLTLTTNATRLDVFEGNVRFTRMSDSMAVRVPAGHYAVAASNYELSALPFTGGIRREWWSGVSGKTLIELHTSPRFPDHPDGWEVASTFELAPVKTNGFAVRFRGYLHPPVTGKYEFWLATATHATLLMSPGENAADAVTIATTQRFGIAARDFNAPRYQGSSLWCPPMPLVAGRRYYLEAQVMIDKGEGHLSVAWKRPGGEREILTGEFLSPYTPK